VLEAASGRERTHLVSATFPAGIRRLAERYQRDPLAVEGTELGTANQDIEHIACRVEDRDRYGALVNLLLVLGGDRTLLFVDTRAETAELAARLGEDGFSAAPLSGELNQAQRTATLAAFIGAGGLGAPIVSGLQLNNAAIILSGAIPAAVLALVVDAALGWCERAATPRQ